MWQNHPELPMPTEGIAINPKRLPHNIHLDLCNANEEKTEENLPCWKSLAGDLQWINTRPEILYIVKELARASGHVTENHKLLPENAFTQNMRKLLMRKDE